MPNFAHTQIDFWLRLLTTGLMQSCYGLLKVTMHVLRNAIVLLRMLLNVFNNTSLEANSFIKIIKTKFKKKKKKHKKNPQPTI